MVLCENGDMEDWHGASENHTWHCGKENVLFMDYEEGQEIKLINLKYKYDRF